MNKIGQVSSLALTSLIKLGSIGGQHFVLTANIFFYVLKNAWKMYELSTKFRITPTAIALFCWLNAALPIHNHNVTRTNCRMTIILFILPLSLPRVYKYHKFLISVTFHDQGWCRNNSSPRIAVVRITLHTARGPWGVGVPPLINSGESRSRKWLAWGKMGPGQDRKWATVFLASLRISNVNMISGRYAPLLKAPLWDARQLPIGKPHDPLHK